jgi:hypothetical protein
VRIESAEDQLQLTANFFDQFQDLNRMRSQSHILSEGPFSAQQKIKQAKSRIHQAGQP